MKIKKFNENVNNDIIEYVKECFIDFIDKGADIEDYESMSNGKACFYIKFRIPSLQFVFILKNKQINNIFDNIKEAGEISEEIQECFNRIMLRYSDNELEVESRVSASTIELTFRAL